MKIRSGMTLLVVLVIALIVLLVTAVISPDAVVQFFLSIGVLVATGSVA